MKRLTFGRFSAYIEPRDIWVGAYVAPNAIYVCPLPLVVLRWARAAGGADRGRTGNAPAAGESGTPDVHRTPLGRVSSRPGGDPGVEGFCVCEAPTVYAPDCGVASHREAWSTATGYCCYAGATADPSPCPWHGEADCPACNGKGVVLSNYPDPCWRCQGWGHLPSVADLARILRGGSIES